MKRGDFSVFLGLLLLASVVFGPHLFNPLLFDDFALILQNQWLKYENIFGFFRSFIPNSGLNFTGYRPLVMTTLSIENEIHQSSPGWLRGFNLLFHIFNAWFVYEIGKFIFKSIENSKTYAGFIACMFLTHTMQTNAVMLVWKRSDIFVTFGILMCLLFFIKSHQSKNKFLLLISFFGAVFAFLSKESAVVLLPLLILVNHFFLRESLWKNKLFFGVILMITLVWAGIVFYILPKTINESIAFTDSYFPKKDSMDRWSYFLSQAQGFIVYAKQMLLPSDSRIFYLTPKNTDLYSVKTFFGFLFVFGLMIFAIRTKNKFISFGIFWIFICLIPTSSLYPLQMWVDEDRLYLPMIGFGVLSACALVKIRKKHSRWLMCLWIFLLSLGSFFRNSEWKNAQTLWAAQVVTEPLEEKGWLNLAVAYEEAKNQTLAQKSFQMTIRLNPDYGVAYHFWGQFLMGQQRYAEAKEKFEKSLNLGVFVPEAYAYLGVIHSTQGSFEEAQKYFDEAVKLKPMDTFVLRNRARFLNKIKKHKEAYSDIYRTLEVEPKNIENWKLYLEHLVVVDKNQAKAKKVYEEIKKVFSKDTKALEMIRFFSVEKNLI